MQNVWSLCHRNYLVSDLVNHGLLLKPNISVGRRKGYNNKACNSGLTRDRNDYLNVKKLAQHECRAAYHEYMSHLIGPHTNNKKFWLHITSCRKDYNGIPTLTVEGNTITDDLDKANALNN